MSSIYDTRHSRMEPQQPDITASLHRVLEIVANTPNNKLKATVELVNKAIDEYRYHIGFRFMPVDAATLDKINDQLELLGYWIEESVEDNDLHSWRPSHHVHGNITWAAKHLVYDYVERSAKEFREVLSHVFMYASGGKGRGLSLAMAACFGKTKLMRHRLGFDSMLMAQHVIEAADDLFHPILNELADHYDWPSSIGKHIANYQ